MNYSFVLLVTLLAYLYYNNGSIYHELNVLKRILFQLFEHIDKHFFNVTNQMSYMRETIMLKLNYLQESVEDIFLIVSNNGAMIEKNLNLTLNNTLAIEAINNKLDSVIYKSYAPELNRYYVVD
ncbi:GP-16 [Urbanus proteus nucleopolyhedrovirus]|uniref:GP-16 n=1 Tax=Urbanus proteus nucleopolyhedrovirus TaxID=1675866 RepID=A0A162GV17_9ABAC|nr:GP-16 [Urbanus proteus nucleopolyhedrovirus]AKR17387.1 GP-16 [Urbanus proteus nucleopolyhedrovirus]